MVSSMHDSSKPAEHLMKRRPAKASCEYLTETETIESQVGTGALHWSAQGAAYDGKCSVAGAVGG